MDFFAFAASNARQEFQAMRQYKVGDRVPCNGGYPGTIVKVHEGQLKGMVDVRLASGVVCVDISDLR